MKEKPHKKIPSPTHHNPPTRERIVVYPYFPGFVGIATVTESVPPPEKDHPKNSTFPCHII